MINDAEIRIRAERRMGEMLRDQEMNKGGGDTSTPRTERGVPTLAEIGITYSMSSRAQKGVVGGL